MILDETSKKIFQSVKIFCCDCVDPFIFFTTLSTTPNTTTIICHPYCHRPYIYVFTSVTVAETEDSCRFLFYFSDTNL